MKGIAIIGLSLLLISCSDGDIDEFAFRKTMEYSLVDLCGEKDKACIAAVKAQVKPCMEKSDWRRYVANEDSDEELKRFTDKFYACIVDKDGDPYFTSNL